MFVVPDAIRVPHRVRLSAGLLCFLSLLTSIQEGRTQTYQNAISPSPAAANDRATSPMLQTARTVVGPDSKLVAPSAAPADRLRHLPATISGWRIDGEIGTLQWPVYLLAAEVAVTKSFRVAYRTSASVLPGVSTISITINDVVVGRSSISSPAIVKPIEFDIPAGLLQRGFNSVKISVDQRHRVDCSPDAAYELWTQILPAETGLQIVKEADRLPLDLSDLAAVLPRPDGAIPIDVVFDGRMKPQEIDRIILAAQAIAAIGKFQMPLVYFSGGSDVAASVKLLIGTEREVARLVELPAERSSMAGPTTFLMQNRNSGTPILVVSGPTEDDVNVAVGLLLAQTKNSTIGAAAGQRSAQNLRGLSVSGGEQIRLGDFGVPDTEFSGRFFRSAIDIAMPVDFLVADYAKLTVDLAGGYAAGLNPGAQVLVDVNGRTGATVALPNSSGDVFRHNEIFVPLDLLRPGPNRIEIIARIPNQTDATCATDLAAEKESKRFLLLANSEVRFPAFARLAHSPDLALTIAGGFPYAGRSGNPKLFVPTPDRESLSAAVTLAVHMSVAAGDLIPFAFTVVRPDPKTNTLIVAPAQALDPTLMKAIELDPAAVRRAWESRAIVSPASVSPAFADDSAKDRRDSSLTGDAGRTVSELTDGPDARGVVANSKLPQGAISSDIVDRWTDMVGQRTFWHRLPDVIKSIVDQGAIAMSRVSSLVHNQAKMRKQPVDSRASLIVAQGRWPGNDEKVVTIVTAPDSRALLRSTELLANPTRWANLRGRLSVIDASGDVVESVQPSTAHFVETQPRSFKNVRLIAAGWLSLNPAVYVIAALAIAAMLALTTISLLQSVGRRNRC